MAGPRAVGRLLLYAVALLVLGLGIPVRAQAPLPHTVDVGVTGFANKRPVAAAACLKGCPWGELGEFVRDALKPLGYDVVLCENCNRSLGPGLVGAAAFPPPLTEDEMELGTLTRVNARIDFGISTAALVQQAYLGQGAYAGRPYPALRLITRVEDPYYVLVALKAGSGITDFSQLKARKPALKILIGSDLTADILGFYGVSREDILAWGGSIRSMIGAHEDEPFDLLISGLSGAAYNPETSFWTVASQRYDLHFLQLPPALLDRLAAKGGMQRVTARCCLLRGFTGPIQTVGSSGEAVFGRADMPEQAAYDIARAIDRNHAALKWFVRPYSYDPDDAWRDPVTPLHPGAARYFRERGYMTGAP